MKIEVRVWPEAAAAVGEKLGYVGGEHDISGEGLLAIVAAGFDIQIRNRANGPPLLQIAPGGRGFSQR